MPNPYSDLVVRAAEKHAPMKARLEAIESELEVATKQYEEAGDDEAAQESAIEVIEALGNEKDALIPEVDKAYKHLETLRKQEKQSAEKAIAAAQQAPNVIPKMKKTEDLAPGTLLVRTALVKGLARISQQPEETILEHCYGDDMALKAVLSMQNRRGRFNKGVMAPADTTTAGWAAELVDNDMRGFLDMIRNVCVGASLASRGTMYSFNGAGTITIPVMNQIQTPFNEPAWIGEGGVIPLTDFSFSSVVLSRYKLATIVPITMELLDASVRDAEQIMRGGIQEAYCMMLDKSMLADSAAVTGTRPAGLLNGVSVGTGDATGGYESIIKDITTLKRALTSNNLGQNPVLILHEDDYISLTMAVNPLGQQPFISAANGGTIYGVPIIHSNNAISGTAIMVEASALATVFDGPQFTASEHASLSMANAGTSAPTQADSGDGLVANSVGGEVAPDGGIHLAGAGANDGVGGIGEGYTARSMFQTWSMALRGVFPTSWTLTRAGAVAALDTLSWGN